jgi:anti-anti-sigma factor
MIFGCRTDGGTLVQVCGELDIATSPVLYEQLIGLIVDNDHVVVDLAGVEFMDSCGLEVLLTCQDSAELAGTELVLRRPSSRVNRLLELTETTAHFRIEDEAPPLPRSTTPAQLSPRADGSRFST